MYYLSLQSEEIIDPFVAIISTIKNIHEYCVEYEEHKINVEIVRSFILQITSNFLQLSI